MLLLLPQEPDECTNDYDHQNYGAPEETILLLRSVENIQEDVCKGRKQNFRWSSDDIHVFTFLPACHILLALGSLGGLIILWSDIRAKMLSK